MSTEACSRTAYDNTLLSCLTRTALPFAPLAVAGDSFPFGTTLMLDAAPMRGSKRVPMLEIAEDGSASIDLWCASAQYLSR